MTGDRGRRVFMSGIKVKTELMPVAFLLKTICPDLSDDQQQHRQPLGRNSNSMSLHKLVPFATRVERERELSATQEYCLPAPQRTRKEENTQEKKVKVSKCF